MYQEEKIQVRSASCTIEGNFIAKIQIGNSSCTIDGIFPEKIQMPVISWKYSAISSPENTSYCIFLISPCCLLKLGDGIDIFLENFCCMLKLADGACIF
jgi:hypothetical protein